MTEDKKSEKIAVKASLDSVGLTDKEKEELDAEAKIELAKELKLEERKAYKDAAKQKLKKQVLFKQGKDDEGHDLEAVLITLAPQALHIQLDGQRYYPGRVYQLNARTAAVIKEQIFRADLHDNEIHGKKMNEFYSQRPRGLTVSPNAPLPAELSN